MERDTDWLIDGDKCINSHNKMGQCRKGIARTKKGIHADETYIIFILYVQCTH